MADASTNTSARLSISIDEARKERAARSIRRSLKHAPPPPGGGGSGSGVGGGAAEPEKQRLEVQKADLPATAIAVRDLLARNPDLFNRAGPVRIAPGPTAWCENGGIPIIRPLAIPDVVNLVHGAAQPYRWRRAGKKFEQEDVTLPDRVAVLYLAMEGHYNLRPLRGCSTVPLLTDDGSIRLHAGYDRDSRFWCVPPLAVTVPQKPSRGDAEECLRELRYELRTFPYADSKLVEDDDNPRISRVDPASSPGADESAALVGLLTAVCRPSLDLAPGLAITAPTLSGSGAGKGLLARIISAIAFGISPAPFTPGGAPGELEKRLGAELIAGGQVVFLDNANGRALQSDALASVLTECPVHVRVLGESRMIELDGRVWVVVAGNGLRIGEDLARRMLLCELDPRCEDPETRPFTPGCLDRIKTARAELLTAVLTIWRWGRQNWHTLKPGASLGSFEMWAAWVRDPLLALGCSDPVERLAKIKAGDPLRNRASELFAVWWDIHKGDATSASDLEEPVIAILDPDKRGRQFQVAQLQRLNGTRAGDYLLQAARSEARWSATRYILTQTEKKPPVTPAADVEGTL